MPKITIRRYNAESVLEPCTIDGYPRGSLAVHKTSSGKHWTVSHLASGHAVTGNRYFDSKAAAVRFADEMQRRLDFGLLKPDADMAWDVQKAFGADAIRSAMRAAFQEAYGA